jgi:hypothetical protein
MGTKDSFDGGHQDRDSGTGTPARRGQQDQAGVRPARCEPLGRKRAQVLDIVRYQRTTLAAGSLENDPVAASDQVVAISDGEHVITGMTQQHRDLWGKVLVQ